MGGWCHSDRDDREKTFSFKCLLNILKHRGLLILFFFFSKLLASVFESFLSTMFLKQGITTLSCVLKEKYSPATTTTTTALILLLLLCHAHGTPPWILKRCGLEISGQRLISSSDKPKRIAFFIYSIFKVFFFLNNKKILFLT